MVRMYVFLLLFACSGSHAGLESTMQDDDKANGDATANKSKINTEIPTCDLTSAGYVHDHKATASEYGQACLSTTGTDSPVHAELVEMNFSCDIQEGSVELLMSGSSKTSVDFASTGEAKNKHTVCVALQSEGLVNFNSSCYDMKVSAEDGDGNEFTFSNKVGNCN